MRKHIVHALKHIGTSEELAHRIDKALDPQHVATREDPLIMNEITLITAADGQALR
ncbi:hypothetical protein [Kistimonas asteriae]|uniref:hypothetical protein n=1 Tax=Kistimonas asteriae TaxID=517724 RepID=UPI001BA849B9|nr:hypothetical protein [Kistimonas asteriae]